MRRQKQPKAIWYRAAHPDGVPPKPRKRIRQVSKARARMMLAYRLRRAVFLRGAKCAAGSCRAKAADIHHTRGRRGLMLLEERRWLPVCRRCHRLIHDNPEAARRLGLLAPVGRWDTPEKKGAA